MTPVRSLCSLPECESHKQQAESSALATRCEKLLCRAPLLRRLCRPCPRLAPRWGTPRLRLGRGLPVDRCLVVPSSWEATSQPWAHVGMLPSLLEMCFVERHRGSGGSRSSVGQETKVSHVYVDDP